MKINIFLHLYPFSAPFLGLLSFCVMFCFILLIFCRSLLFSNERHKGRNREKKGDGEELGGVEGEKPIVRICYMRT